jgi:hypothetical protein
VVLRPAATVRPARQLPLVAEDVPGSVALGIGAEEPKPRSENVPRVGRDKPAEDAGPVLSFSPEPDYPPYLFWSLTDRRGVLRRYETRAVTQRLVVQVPRRLLRGGDVLRVHFNGYTHQYSE